MVAETTNDDDPAAPKATDELVVVSAVNVTWLSGQTKGTAEIEIDFRGLAQTDVPIEIGFACHEVSIGRAAAEVLAYFFLSLTREALRKPESYVDRVDLGDAGNMVVFAIDSKQKGVPDFLLTVDPGENCDTRAEAAIAAAERLRRGIERSMDKRAKALKAAVKRLDPVKDYYPEALVTAITAARRSAA